MSATASAIMATQLKDGVTIKKVSTQIIDNVSTQITNINNIRFALHNSTPITLQNVRDVAGCATKLLVAFKQRANLCSIIESNM